MDDELHMHTHVQRNMPINDEQQNPNLRFQ